MHPGRDVSTSLERDIAERVEVSRPATLLLIGPGAADLVSVYRNAHPECEVEILSAEQVGRLSGLGRYDLAFVVRTLEQLPADVAGRVLGSLRDVHAKSLLVLVDLGHSDEGTRWRHADLLSYGLQRIREYFEEGQRLALYRFDLYDYKTTPDWLNSESWAHPELWGKHRW